MQLPIPVETILQNRYRILKVLGQGGFGRTYLAEDRGRFNEYCALKEYIPNHSSAYALEKSRELFQREATILYQLKHAQVPEFRATFEEGQRLFLVQDYVHGKTYRELLDERINRNMAFAEPEVLWLVQNLLPVLAHVHSKGIIHRDITPDNIILRHDDHLPVLIDFGVVKEIATRLHHADDSIQSTTAQPTTVGKPGYAPSEQVQTGRAYPSSDLYALAVTAVVLLTGHEPQDLFDDVMLTWNWQRWARISPQFTEILNRMLSYRPGDRYQSVSDVIHALNTMYGAPHVAPPPASSHPPASASSSVSPPRPVASPSAHAVPPIQSQVQTVAVGRRANASAFQPPPSTRAAYRSTHAPLSSVPAKRQTGSVWDNPLSVLGIGFALAVVTGIGSWAVVSAIFNAAPDEELEPPPPVVEAPAVEPEPELPTEPSEPQEYRQEIALTVGVPVRLEGTLKQNETLNYLVSGTQAQLLSADLENEGVLMTVLAPNGELVDGRSQRVLAWEGELEFTGDYTLQISPVDGVEETDYRLVVELRDPEPEEAPEPEILPEPTIETEQLNFEEGSDGVLVTAQANATTIRRYLVNVRAGQGLRLELLEGPVTLSVRFPNGDLVEDASGVVFWEAEVPESGNYQIDVVADDAASFKLEVRAFDLD
ncbi:MAG: serine/threonine-protein kinase [Cyanobacteria bacterium P01_E01_bin.6]